jgi:hypothetical protein
VNSGRAHRPAASATADPSIVRRRTMMLEVL